jgi:membrane fusion protein (multidrug efflux system)
MNTPRRETTAARRLALRLTPLAVLVAALGVGILPRIDAHAALREQTQALAEPTVEVVQPTLAPATRSIELPGDVQAFQEANIYARTSGYIGHWYSDIGSAVKSGQLLATIDAPEVDAQLLQARADAATALVNYKIAKVTADRWVGLLKSNSVSQQQTEQFVSDMQAKQAMLASASANVDRLAQLQSYEKVTAPFDGVITVRNIDNGALINAGSAGGANGALFHLAEVDKLRVFVDVPQNQAQDIDQTTQARISLPQKPGQVFTGTVTRTAGALDPSSRTLRVEVDVDNPGGLLLPGAFAQVSLLARARQPGLSLPLNALLFRPSGPQVATVDGNGKVKLVTVTPGRDFGTQMEIRSGLTARDRVILNPGDAISEGQPVRVVASKKAPA